MNVLKTYLPVALIAVWMIGGGVAHFMTPSAFYAIVPNVFPKDFVIYASGVAELLVGVGILIPKTRAIAGLGFAALCLCFLPLHVWDVFRETPAIGPLPISIIRVFVQFLLIWIGWRVWQRGAKAG